MTKHNLLTTYGFYFLVVVLVRAGFVNAGPGRHHPEVCASISFQADACVKSYNWNFTRTLFVDEARASRHFIPVSIPCGFKPNSVLASHLLLDYLHAQRR